jgi:hypothetical protein
MFEQKRFAGRHLLTFKSQKLNYFGKKGGPAFWHYNAIRIWAMTYSIYVLGFIKYDTYMSWSCQWSLMSLITGNKVKKKTRKPRYCEKEKDKANKRILRSLSFDSYVSYLMKPRTYIEYVLDETYKFNLKSSIFNKI